MRRRREPAPRCLVCAAPMSRMYVQAVIEGRRSFVPVGWGCGACRLMNWD